MLAVAVTEVMMASAPGPDTFTPTLLPVETERSTVIETGCELDRAINPLFVFDAATLLLMVTTEPSSARTPARLFST